VSVQENAIQGVILRYLKLNGYVVWRQNNAPIFDRKRNVYRAHNGMKGLPDIQGMMPLGKLTHPQSFFIEVKTQKGKVSPEQAAFIETATRHGHLAFVARSLDDVIARGM
jgi:hypothetical protein